MKQTLEEKIEWITVHFTVAEVARNTGMSEYTLAQIFRQELLVDDVLYEDVRKIEAFFDQQQDSLKAN